MKKKSGLLTCGPVFFVTEDRGGQRRTEELGILVVGYDDTEEDIVGAGSGQSMTQNLHADIIQKFSSYQRKVTTD